MDIGHPVLMSRSCGQVTQSSCAIETAEDEKLGKNVTSYQCACQDHKCNAFGPVLLDGKQVHIEMYLKR